MSETFKNDVFRPKMIVFSAKNDFFSKKLFFRQKMIFRPRMIFSFLGQKLGRLAKGLQRPAYIIYGI